MTIFSNTLSMISRVFILAIALMVPPSTSMISHRGFGLKGYPENTVESIEDALDSGFQGVEIDVYEGRDGSVLVFHDDNLYRMTDKKGKIWDLTEDSRKDYLIDGKYKIPTLNEILDVMKDRPGSLFIHVKDKKEKGYQAPYSIFKRISIILNDYGMTDRTTVFSDIKTIMAVGGRDDINYGIIIQNRSFENFINILREGRDKKINTVIILDFDKFMKDGKEKLMLLHDHGIKVGIYTLDSGQDFADILNAGIDFLIFD